MMQIMVFFAIVVLSALSVFSQSSVANYSGTWTLDLANSKLDERSRIESMKMTVSQTDKEITVATETKRPAPPANAPQGRPGGGMGRGGFGGGDGKFTYSLDGKETSDVQVTGMGSTPVKLKAQSEGGKLKLSTTRTINSQMGEVTLTTKEEWGLSADGKTLTVNREMETPRGTNSVTLVFTKN